MKVTKYASILCLFIVLLVAFLAVDYITEQNYYTIKKQNSFGGVNYDSNLTDLAASTQFSETLYSTYKDVKISFKMSVYSIDNYNNLFQTAPLNNGLRMELTPAGKLAFLVKNSAYDVIERVDLNKWYNISITINKYNRVTILVDSKKVTDIYIGNTIFDLSDIIVGAGYNNTRFFSGAINDFKIEYKLYNRNVSIEWLTKVAKIVLFTFTFIISFFVIFPHEIRVNKS